MLYLIDPMDTSSKLQELLQQKKNAQMEAGKQFLAENAKRAEVQQTPTGLQYEILQAGTGNKPGPTTMVTVHYEGKLIDGTVFDSSFKRNQPATFGLHQVIPGWTEGVQLMKDWINSLPPSFPKATTAQLAGVPLDVIGIPNRFSSVVLA